MSPWTILTGHHIEYTTHCQLEYGEYVQTHEEHDNSMQPRTIGALSLCPMGNVQGGYFFFSLTTGCVLNRNRLTQLPMPSEVTDHVHRMGCKEKANCSLVFENQNRDLLPDQDDDDDDVSYSPSVTDGEAEYELLDPIVDSDNHTETQGVDTGTPEQEQEPTMIGDGAPPPAIHTGPKQVVPKADAPKDIIIQPMGPDTTNPITESSHEATASQQVEPEVTDTPPLMAVLVPPGTEQELCQLEINDEVPNLTRGHTRLQSWQLNLTTIGDPPIPIKQMTPFEQDLFTQRIKGVHLPASLTTLNHTIMTQYTLSKGLQVFSPLGKEAVFCEMQQLHQWNVCEPCNRPLH